MYRLLNTNIILLILVVSSFLINSCGGSSESVDSSGAKGLSLSIQCPNIDEGQSAKESSGKLEDVMFVDVSVAGGEPEIKEIFEEFDAQANSMIVNVPVGENRVFRIFGKDIERHNMCTGVAVADINFDTNEVVITCNLNDEICFDDIDNDGNGLADCEDPQCKSSSCDESNPFGLVCINSICQDPQNPVVIGDDDDDSAPAGTGGIGDDDDDDSVPPAGTGGIGDDDDDDSAPAGTGGTGDDDDDDSAPAGGGSGGSGEGVTICHLSSQTITVSLFDLIFHLFHGDTLGACSGGSSGPPFFDDDDGGGDDGGDDDGGDDDDGDDDGGDDGGGDRNLFCDE